MSPLRTRDVGWVKAAVCGILQANAYESFENMNDFSDVEHLGNFLVEYMSIYLLSDCI